MNGTSVQAPIAERKISRRAQLLGAAGLVAGAAALRPGVARADSTPSGPLTIQSSSSTDSPLTLVGAPGQRADLFVISEADGSTVTRVNSAGALYLGSPTRQAMVRFVGNPSYSGAPAGEEIAWELGLDDGRQSAPLRDFFIAQRTGTDTVADIFYMRDQGAGQQPTVSVAAPNSGDTHLASLTVGVWGTNVSQAYHNLAILVRDTANPPQLGKALTVIGSTEKHLFSVAVDGTTEWRTSGGGLLASVARNGDIMSTHQISTTPGGWISAGGTGANIDYAGVEAMGGIWATSARPQIVTGVLKAMAGQSADILQCRDGSSKPHFSVTSDGLPKWASAADQQQSVGSSGSAQQMPNRPSKYLKVVDSNGDAYVVPAFRAS
jgi:hypothetical protein